MERFGRKVLFPPGAGGVPKEIRKMVDNLQAFLRV